MSRALLVAFSLAVALAGCGDGFTTEVRIELLYPEGQSPLADAETLFVEILADAEVDPLPPLERPSSGSWDDLDASVSIGNESIDSARIRLEGYDAAGVLVCAGESISLPLIVGQPGRARLFLQSTGTSGAAPPLGAPVSAHAAAYLSAGGVLLAGGEGGETGSFVYSLDLFEPIEVAPLPAGRSGAAALPLGEDRVLVIGGSEPQAEAALYDAFDDGWEALPLPVEVSGAWPHPAVASGSDGGVLAFHFPAILRVSAGISPEVTILGELEGPEILFPTLSVIGGGLVVIVGDGERAVAAFDVGAGEALELPAPPAGARRGHGAVVLGDGRLVLVAGRGSDGLIEDLEVLDADGQAWTVLPGLLEGLGRVSAAVTRLDDDRIVAVGGEDEAGQARGDIVVIDVSAPSVDVIPLETPRRGHSATLLPSGVVLVAGGLDGGGAPTSSVEMILPLPR